MSVRRYVLEGRRIWSLEDLYDEIGRALPLPDHFGRNLDALWDVLSTDIEGPFEILWQHADISRKAIGVADFDRVVTLFQDLEEERDDFTFQVLPSST